MIAKAPEESLSSLLNCTCCPRNCGANRASDKLGYCQCGAGFPVASIFPHRGEEPVISGSKGICNIFFAHCNMQCIYCQNYQISRNDLPKSESGLNDVIIRIENLFDTGIRAVGFVSPSHCIPQMKTIMQTLESRGRKPVYVFNTNAYDKIETIESLETEMDVYLPDLKYMDEELASSYSDAPGYPEVAAEALKEMYRQKGSNIVMGDDGIIESGLIVRHLILPGKVENSRECLRFIAEELSISVHVSLMAQYYPTPMVAGHPDLDRYLLPEEYNAVLEEFERLGFWRGWVQDLESPHFYRPDFGRADAFG